MRKLFLALLILGTGMFVPANIIGEEFDSTEMTEYQFHQFMLYWGNSQNPQMAEFYTDSSGYYTYERIVFLDTVEYGDIHDSYIRFEHKPEYASTELSYMEIEIIDSSHSAGFGFVVEGTAGIKAASLDYQTNWIQTESFGSQTVHSETMGAVYETNYPEEAGLYGIVIADRRVEAVTIKRDQGGTIVKAEHVNDAPFGTQLRIEQREAAEPVNPSC